jgi:hypothetical protein
MRSQEGHREMFSHTRLFLIGFSMVGGLLFVASLHAASSNRPFWTEQSMFRFGEDLFFTGRATCAPSSEEGRQRAYNAAMQEMLNYSRATEVTGVTIETQMTYEEDNSETCRKGQVSVWRLLRAPAAKLDRLNRMAAQQAFSQDQRKTGAPQSKQVLDLTPKIGMHKDEALQAFGQPKSVTLVRRGSEANWEYPRFGLTLIFDSDGYLLRWRHAGPASNRVGDPPSPQRAYEYAGLEGSIDPELQKKTEQESVDLSKRLEKMQSESRTQENQTSANRYCERAYPRDKQLRESCIQYELEKQRMLSSGSGWLDADRTAKVMCTHRWPNDASLRDSCQKFERQKLLDYQSRRY